MSDDNAIKPGKTTSEFKLSYVAIILSSLVAAVFEMGLPEAHWAVKVATILSPILVSLGYNHSRGMAKSAKILVVALVLSLLTGCLSTIPAKAVTDIEETHDIILPEYIEYVETDPDLDDDEKDDARKLVGSLERLVDALKKHTED